MKKTTQKLKLDLKRQTLRVLVQDDLPRVAGGLPTGGDAMCSNERSGCASNYSINC